VSFRSQQWIVTLVDSAPLWLGIPAWVVLGKGDLIYYFAPGLFMLAAALLIAAVARLASKGLAKEHASRSLRFHSWILLGVCIWALGIPIASYFDPPNPTMSNPPAVFEAVMATAFFVSAFILPLVELVRAVFWILRVWKARPPTGIPSQAGGIM